VGDSGSDKAPKHLSLTAFISSPWLPGSSKPIPLFPVTALFHVTYFFHEYGSSTHPRGTGNYCRKYTASRSVRLTLRTETISYGSNNCCMDRACDLEMDLTVVSSPRV